MGYTGIFGGSFDPLHQAHIEVVESCLRSGACDEIWVLPSRVSPFKQGKHVTAFEHRYRMAELAFKDLPGVWVLPLEQQLPPPSYTLKTLQHLQRQYPERSWKLCIGSDNLASFERWYRYREILKIAGLLVALRPGYDEVRNTADIDPDILAATRFVEHRPRRLSSTALREQLNSKIPEADMIPEAVLRYIREHGLYATKGDSSG